MKPKLPKWYYPLLAAFIVFVVCVGLFDGRFGRGTRRVSWPLILVGAGIAAALWKVLSRYELRSSRYQRRMCVQCGYDLRASTERCPECGTAIEKPLA